MSTAPDFAVALPPQYQFERELGRGGMATVYLAYDRKHDRRVAIKVLRPECVPGFNGERFLREIRVAAKLTHPHIVALYDSGEAAGLPFYVMAYVEGETLRQRLEQEKRLSLETSLDIVREVGGALQFAHDQGVIHRDVKPENILLAHGHALLADFGIAHALESVGVARLTAAGVVVGTPSYMSPEQWSDDAVDGRADLYGLACVLYEMLGGQPPFAGPSAVAIMLRHARDPVLPISSLRPGTPASLSHNIERALAKSPNDRFTSVATFVKALANPKETPRNPSIVVLPFANLSPDPDNEYFADGLTEDVIMDLSRVRALTVISRTSSMLLKGTRLDTRAIGRELNVRYVLEGTVRRAGPSVRVTAQLIDAERDAHLWAERYSGTVDDVFEMQEQLAKRIVEALHVALTKDEEIAIAHRPVADPRAVEFYHRARQEMYRMTADGIERAHRLLEAGIEIVGENAVLRAAQAYACVVALGGAVSVSADLICEAERYTELAERLDPEAGTVLFLRATIALQRGDLETAVRLFRQSLSQQPGNPDAMAQLHFALALLGRTSGTAELIDEAFRLDPLTSVFHAFRGFVLLVDGHFELAIPHFLRWRQMEPGNPFARLALMAVYIFTRRHELARDEAAGLRELAPDSLPGRIGTFLTYGLQGDRAMAKASVTADVIKAANAPDVQITWFLAWGHGLAGDYEVALEWIDRQVALGAMTPAFWRSLWFMHPLLDDPRFIRLMDRIEQRTRAFDS